VPEQAALPAERAFSFGPFRLLPAQQLLVEADRPVRLGSRALEILVTLVERAGELVTKDELVARVWPDTHVEEGNLRVHVAAVRRALGDGQAGNRFVANVPGRGYCFVAPVALSQGQTTAPPPAAVSPAHNL
jgi:DNA-binding winged helix-turn-helix (wHTH) protein